MIKVRGCGAVLALMLAAAGPAARYTLAAYPATQVTVGALAAHPVPVGAQIIGPLYEDDTAITFAGLLADVTGGFRPLPLHDRRA